MPIDFVNEIPSGNRGGKIVKTTEWKEIEQALSATFPVGQALRLTVSKDTVTKSFKNNIKSAIVSFGQKLRSVYEPKGFKIKIVGEAIYISKDETGKSDKKVKSI